MVRIVSGETFTGLRTEALPKIDWAMDWMQGNGRSNQEEKEKKASDPRKQWDLSSPSSRRPPWQQESKEGEAIEGLRSENILGILKKILDKVLSQTSIISTE